MKTGNDSLILPVNFYKNMPQKLSTADFINLQEKFSGALFFNHTPLHNSQKLLYSTDASVYQEKPVAVAIPKTNEDLKALIRFAREQKLSLIPRAAGTSLAGQVVGAGLVVDISKYFDKILEVNTEEKWVRVQPGVIRDDLNVKLREYGLMFGPETSTSSRAMIGGMVGNNSCGLHSIVWGCTRDHLLEASVLLSDGTEAIFRNLDRNEFYAKASQNNLEGNIYREIHKILHNPFNQENIVQGFPKKSIKRRNTGYALDMLIDNQPFTENEIPFNFCKLLAGSEGTLAFITEVKLNLLPLPPKEAALVCVHCNSIDESLKANLVALAHKPTASELVDKYILDFTIGHHEYEKNRFFIEGDPKAILMVEFMSETLSDLKSMTDSFIADLKNAGLGYAHPVVWAEQTKPAWDVRKAGLGLIRNLPGDTQPVNLIEDCAVDPQDLPQYIADLEVLLKKHSLNASYYAHAGAGELHVEPMINLKTTEGKNLFRTVLKETAALVKTYNGSLSGEHGDGRLRGEFIEFMIGPDNFALLHEVKRIFDPQNIFNSGKITNTPPMNESLRYEAEKRIDKTETIFDFSEQEGILRLSEKCSGSGDCRKTELTGGTMCPSYMATRQEKDTTRARANILRQFLTNSTKENKFDHPEIKEVMDLCLSCKGCKSECPSSVDIAKMKGEFLQHYYDANGVPFRTKMIGNFTRSQELASHFPGLYNFVISNPVTEKLTKKILGFAQEREIPKLASQTLKAWAKDYFRKNRDNSSDKGIVYLFCDEFTNFNDAEIGQKAIKLLSKLGYEVVIPNHLESGRTYLSKGLVREAQKIAIKNVQLLSDSIPNDRPIIGIEPSAILTLRDEYLDLVPASMKEDAKKIAKKTFLIDEFIAAEIDEKRIRKENFTTEKKLIKLHGHCHQKALSNLTATKKMLSVPDNYEVQLIPSGCCGMAGSFGFEEEHYETSMKIGELVLFPTIRKQAAETIIAANGTSCRHQIKDGTGRTALHPVEILWEALL